MIYTYAIFVGFLVANLWKPRFFCRFVCPLGALLGVFAAKRLFRINRIVDRHHEPPGRPLSAGFHLPHRPLVSFDPLVSF